MNQTAQKRAGIHCLVEGDCLKVALGRNTLWYGLRSIQWTGAKLWNGLPKAIRALSLEFKLEKHLKSYFLNAMYH